MNKFLPSGILLLTSIYHVYHEFTINSLISNFDRRIYNDLYFAALFLLLALLGLKYSNNRIFQWVTMIAAILWAGGGFLGFGWIVAIALGVVYFLVGKKSSKV